MLEKPFYQDKSPEELKALPFSFARICLYLYDVDVETQEEIYRYRGEATTVGQLCGIIDTLPGNTDLFEIQFCLVHQIIGNAIYRVHHWINDPTTGKHASLYNIEEYGACKGFWRYFAALYQTVLPYKENESSEA